MAGKLYTEKLCDGLMQKLEVGDMVFYVGTFSGSKSTQVCEVIKITDAKVTLKAMLCTDEYKVGRTASIGYPEKMLKLTEEQFTMASFLAL